ncbi:MAG TPA: polysaccharide biosynthesis/export family protein [Aliidongia sp.]|nr:polysaccharide biosynthesis/export family protein [Aliidongia sp.]
MRTFVYRLFAVLILASTLAACRSDLQSLPPLGSAVLDTASYKLGPGDKLSLIVFGVKDLSVEVEVAAEGTIAIPLVDNVQAAGLTVNELAEAVRKKLTPGYVLDPKVTIQIVSYRPFFILGEVKTPGHYPFIPGMTVTNAVVSAGGYTPRAYKDGFTVTRNGSNYKADPSSKLLPDDVVNVEERYF